MSSRVRFPVSFANGPPRDGVATASAGGFVRAATAAAFLRFDSGAADFFARPRPATTATSARARRHRAAVAGTDDGTSAPRELSAA